jgi:hypothetical protein
VKRGSLPQESKSSLEKGKHKNKNGVWASLLRLSAVKMEVIVAEQNSDPEICQK